MISVKEIQPGIPFKRDGDTAMYIKLSPEQEYYHEPSEGFSRAMNTRTGSAPTLSDKEMVQVIPKGK